MTAWHDSKKESDQFLDEIKMIIGRTFISEPEREEEDSLRNTDLIVFKMEAIRVACRVRKMKYYDDYGDEFTIRSKRPSGNKTELTKILEGWGDYLFYGFGTDGGSLFDWRIGDLKQFRIWFQRETAKRRPGELPGIAQSNTDGSSDFRAFKWDDLPGEFVVDRMSAENVFHVNGG